MHDDRYLVFVVVCCSAHCALDLARDHVRRNAHYYVGLTLFSNLLLLERVLIARIQHALA